ncbi:SRPBCC domain-containing protein, partial [Arthrobacter deserti]|nr:SRPBCC domain-containing protein [Arthrobacter deserti]
MNVEKTVIVPLDPGQTFALLTEPGRLRRWNIIAGRIAARVGEESRMTVAPGCHAVGRLLELEPGRKVSWTQSWEGRDELPDGAATVTITLEPVEEGTRLILVHGGLDPEQAAGHAEGWDWYLGRLLVLAAGGDPGPDDWGGLLEEADAAALADASLAVLLRVLRDLPPEAMGCRTPCRDFDVAALLEHLAGSLAAAAGELGVPAGAAGPGPAEERIAGLAQPVLEAFTRRLRAG